MTIAIAAPAVPPAAAPIATSERSLAPDIARGFMLLFIALANLPLYLYGRSLDVYGTIGDSSDLDRWVRTTEAMLILDRSRPMFAILYGFGMAMMASRLIAKLDAAGAPHGYGVKRARVLLAKRSVWLIVLGVLHAVFLFMGDILAPYGLTGLIALAFIAVSDRALKRLTIASFAFVSLVTVPLMAFVMAWSNRRDKEQTELNIDLPPYGVSMVEGMLASFMAGIFSVVLLAFVPMVLAGMMLHRAGWLTDPGMHLRSLKLTFGIGMAVGLASATPVALIAWGAWEPGLVGHAVAVWATMTGGAIAGLGYIAGFALLAHRLSGYGRRGPIRALASLGERSLTGYLTQSIIAAPLLSLWGFGLGHQMGYAAAAAVAIAIWLVTIAICYALDRAGKRGPFETLLRRLVYGKVAVTPSP